MRILPMLIAVTSCMAACSNCSDEPSEPPTPELTFVPSVVRSVRAQVRTTSSNEVTILNRTAQALTLRGFEALLETEDTPSVLFGVDLDGSECRPDQALGPGDSCNVAVTFSPVVYQTLPAENDGDDTDFSAGRLKVEFSTTDGTTMSNELRLEGRGRLLCGIDPDAISPESDEWQARYRETVGGDGPANGLRRQPLTAAERLAWETRIREVWVPDLNMRTGYAMDPNSIHVYGPGGDFAEDLSDLGDEIVVGLADAESDEDGRRVLGTAIEVERTTNPDGSVQWSYNPNGPDCLLYFPASISWESRPVVDAESTMVHELFHCYQYRFFDSTPSSDYPDWLVEGTAEYVGEVLVGGTAMGLRRFDDYIGEREALFDREYDAMPFFHHVQLTGADVLSRTPSWVETTDAALFAKITGAISDRTMYGWAPGIWEDENLGSDWDTSVPGHADAGAQTPKIQIDAASMGSEASAELQSVTPTHIEFALEDDKFYKITVTNAYGKWRNQRPDGEDIDEIISGEKQMVICTGHNCKCPRGDEPLDDVIEVAQSTTKFALTAPPGGNGSVEFREIQPTCCENVTDTGNGPYEEMVGAWDLDMTEFLAWEVVQGVHLDDCEVAASGSATLEIHPSGQFTKNYSALVKTSTCTRTGGTVYVDETKLTGMVRGCISKRRPISGNYHFDVAAIRDGTTGVVTRDGAIVQRGDGQTNEFIWAWFGPRDHDAHTESGLVNFPAPGRMSKGGTVNLAEGSYTWVFRAPISE